MLTETIDDAIYIRSSRRGRLFGKYLPGRRVIVTKDGGEECEIDPVQLLAPNPAHREKLLRFLDTLAQER